MHIYVINHKNNYTVYDSCFYFYLPPLAPFEEFFIKWDAFLWILYPCSPLLSTDVSELVFLSLL